MRNVVHKDKLMTRSELKIKPHEKTVRMFFTWTILQIEMSRGQQLEGLGGIFIPPLHRSIFARYKCL